MPSPHPHTPPSRGASTRFVIALVLGLLAGLSLGGAYALHRLWQELPSVAALTDYRPKLPLRIHARDGRLLAEYGEERRELVAIEQIPKRMREALLAIEDAGFYAHRGVDFSGLARAAWSNLFAGGRAQGGSTITMQVARMFFLSPEKTYRRKIMEVLLACKLEAHHDKDTLLELYMNQVYLGERAYGFAAAASVYFDKALHELTLAEAAMLAGLPKAPSAYNPISNPKRARIRQLYIIDRMLENGFITAEQAAAAKQEDLKLRSSTNSTRVHAEYVAEMARQLVFSQYGAEAYTRGLNVYTTLNAGEQEAAYAALRKGIMDYERRQHYRGPERFVNLPASPAEAEDAIDDVLASHPDNGDVLAAVVLEASSKKIVAARADGEQIEITGEGLKPAQSGLSDKAPPNIKLRRGAVIRVVQTPKKTWEITQLPEVEGAFVAMDPRTGAIHALVGGFDFDKNKFNHATQAWRQPGSAFKPFIYSAALEKGFTPATVVNDAPLFFSAGATGAQPWEPKNYDGKYDGPMTLRTGLARSKNVVSIRVLQAVGPKTAQDWVTRFGFDADKHPAYLTMALGAGSVTPMQMATAYSVFANGGYRVNPYLVTRVTDHKGRVLSNVQPPATTDNPRAIDARNAFVMDSLLQEVTRSGTAARAQATLKRPDLYGKTGTTNDSMDAWFAGFQPTVTAVTWIGYDQPRNLGSRETGGGLSLPIWISFMQTALKNVPVMTYDPPAGVTNIGGEWYYDEFGPGNSVNSLGMSDPAAPGSSEGAIKPTPTEERRSILDLFRN